MSRPPQDRIATRRGAGDRYWKALRRRSVEIRSNQRKPPPYGDDFLNERLTQTAGIGSQIDAARHDDSQRPARRGECPGPGMPVAVDTYHMVDTRKRSMNRDRIASNWSPRQLRLASIGLSVLTMAWWAGLTWIAGRPIWYW